MAQLTKIWINQPSGSVTAKPEIRLDWDNDRHQTISLFGNSPHDVLDTLEKAVNIVRQDIDNKEI